MVKKKIVVSYYNIIRLLKLIFIIMATNKFDRYITLVVCIIVVVVCVVLVVSEYLFLRQKTKSPTEIYLKLIEENIFENTSIVAFNFGEWGDKFKNYYLVDTEDETTDTQFQLKIEDKPVKFDGTFYVDNNYDNEIQYIDNGFRIPGVDESIVCPLGWGWSFVEKRCILEPLCTDLDIKERTIKGLTPFYFDKYFTKINFSDDTFKNDNSQLMLSRVDVTHNFVYAICTGVTPTFEYCTNNTKYVNELSLTPKDPQYDAPCVIYDICVSKADNFIHVQKIDSTDLTSEEYYICQGGKSILKTCPKSYTFNIPYMTCMFEFVDFCVDKEDGYNEQIDDRSYFECHNKKKYIIKCTDLVLINPTTGNCECYNVDCKSASDLVPVDNTFLFTPYYESITVCNVDCDGINNSRDVVQTQKIDYDEIRLTPDNLVGDDLYIGIIDVLHLSIKPKLIEPTTIKIPKNGLSIKTCPSGNAYGINEQITEYNTNNNQSINLQGLYFDITTNKYVGYEGKMDESEESETIEYYVNYIDISTKQMIYENPDFGNISRIIDVKDYRYKVEDIYFTTPTYITLLDKDNKEYLSTTLVFMFIVDLPNYTFVSFQKGIYEYEAYNLEGTIITLVITEELLSTYERVTTISAEKTNGLYCLYDRYYNPLPINYFVPIFMLNLDIMGLDLSEHLTIKEDDTLVGFDVFKCDFILNKN